MSVFTHTRKPLVPSECSESYLKQLQKSRAYDRTTGLETIRYVFTFCRYSRRKHSAQLHLCQEVQRRIEFVDAGRNAITQEGVHRSSVRQRRQSTRDIDHDIYLAELRKEELRRESAKEEKEWKKQEKRLRKEMYSTPRAVSSTTLVEGRGESEPSGSSSEDASDGYESEEEPQPRSRRVRIDDPRVVNDRRPRDEAELQQQHIREAVEFLSRMGITTNEPNGCKSNC